MNYQERIELIPNLTKEAERNNNLNFRLGDKQNNFTNLITHMKKKWNHINYILYVFSLIYLMYEYSNTVSIMDIHYCYKLGYLVE